MTESVWGYLQVLQDIKKEKKMTNKEHDFFYKLLQIFRFFVTFEVHLSFFCHFQYAFITYFNASTFYLKKKIIQGF